MPANKNYIVSYKNGLVYYNNDELNKIRISDINDIKKLKIENPIFKLNKQGMSTANRSKIEELANGYDVSNNTLYPNDDLEQHFKSAIEFKSKIKKAIEMDKADIETLNKLIKKYNKSTINKYTRINQ